MGKRRTRNDDYDEHLTGRCARRRNSWRKNQEWQFQGTSSIKSGGRTSPQLCDANRGDNGSTHSASFVQQSREHNVVRESAVGDVREQDLVRFSGFVDNWT